MQEKFSGTINSVLLAYVMTSYLRQECQIFGYWIFTICVTGKRKEKELKMKNVWVLLSSKVK